MRSKRTFVKCYTRCQGNYFDSSVYTCARTIDLFCYVNIHQIHELPSVSGLRESGASQLLAPVWLASTPSLVRFAQCSKITTIHIIYARQVRVALSRLGRARCMNVASSQLIVLMMSSWFVFFPSSCPSSGRYLFIPIHHPRTDRAFCSNDHNKTTNMIVVSYPGILDKRRSCSGQAMRISIRHWKDYWTWNWTHPNATWLDVYSKETIYNSVASNQYGRCLK